jgi:hypothetical protein
MTCTPKFTPVYTDSLQMVFVREWLRGSGGSVALSNYDRRTAKGETFKVPDDIQDKIRVCVESMRAGKTVPGVRISKEVSPQDDKCYQNWFETACFAYWYFKVDDLGRLDIQQKLEAGNREPLGELDCPAGISQDPIYAELNKPSSSSSMWGPLLGLGIFGVGLAWILTKKTP